MGKPTIDQIKENLRQLDDRELVIEQTTWLRLNQRRLVAIEKIISTWSWIYAIVIAITVITILVNLS